MNLFPLFADLRHRPVLVVGGGTVAARKAGALLEAGAHVTVGSPVLGSELTQLTDAGRVRHISGEFSPDWLDDVWLVVAATDDTGVNAAVFAAATARHMFCNVVDDPVRSSFQVPSIVDRSPLIVAISSSGTAPVLARRMRERIETSLDHSIGQLATLAARYRPGIRQRLPDLRARRQFYDWLLDGPVAAWLRRQQPARAEAALQQALRRDEPVLPGRVTLVGAGPGDPGLLTLKALRALNEADVILHDRLVSDAVLSMARRDAERISVGKRPGEDHEATQARIHRLMVAHACAGRHVVRLKGGDPFIFGRGGEELAYLRAHGVHYDVVPGITAALACAAHAGIPLTHRDSAQSVTLTTAHVRENGQGQDWAGLARGRQTLAIYMGVGQLVELCRLLIVHGRPADTPAALIENGSRPGQRALHGTLETLAAQAQAHNIAAPALLIIGEVARLGETLHWFGSVVPAADKHGTTPEPAARDAGIIFDSPKPIRSHPT